MVYSSREVFCSSDFWFGGVFLVKSVKWQLQAEGNTMNAKNNGLFFGLLLLTQLAHSGPLDTWTWRNPLPTGNALRSVTFGNGSFVAVGDSGTIVSSSDGIKWTLRHCELEGTDYRLAGITYGKGFVAVGSSISDGSQAVVTSTDGMSWARAPLGTNNFDMNGIAFGNGQFVAIGNADVIGTSPDGVHWTQHQSGLGLYGLSSIVYGGGQFVAVGDTAILTSPDGVNWVKRPSGLVNTTNTTSLLTGITYGAGRFVAVGDVFPGNSVSVLTSTDALNWVKRPVLNVSLYPFAVSYGNGEFVIVAERGILTSPDAVSWSLSTPERDPFAVTYASGQFVAVGDAGTIITSTDGMNWVQRQSRSPDELNSVAYGKGRFVADVSAEPRAPVIAISSNLTTWVQTGPESFPAGWLWLSRVAYAGGRFFALGVAVSVGGYVGGYLASSTDGETWVTSVIDPTWSVSAVAYGQNQFVAVGDSILTSVDAISWTNQQVVDMTNSPVFGGVAFGNGQFVAVGHVSVTLRPHLGVFQPVILTSFNGVNWVQRDISLSISNVSLAQVVYAGNQFVAVGSVYPTSDSTSSGSIILTSKDGVNWIQRETGTEGSYLSDIAWGGGQFVAVGATLVTSSDGVTWTQRLQGPSYGLSCVAYGDGRFIAVGGEGAILESGEIITLSQASNNSQGLTVFSLTGPIGARYTIQTSSDLVFWQDLTNLTTTISTTIIPIHPPPPHVGQNFYRAHSE
jgi:hypothetical protein